MTPRVTAAAMAASVRSSSLLWISWSKIAISHLHAAQHHRALSLKTRREKRDPSHLFAEALGDETRAAMVAVSAAAHAIDAFYGACKPFITLLPGTEQQWITDGTERQSRIFETLRAGFAIDGKTNSWPAEFRWLFEIRDAAVQFEEKVLELVDHPTGTETSIDHATYSLESAARAVLLLLDVLATCQACSRPHQGVALVGSAGQMGEDVARIEASYQGSAVP